MKYLYTIKPEDLKKRFLNVTCKYCNNKTQYNLQDSIGYIQKIDIGKKLYLSKNNNIYIKGGDLI